MLTTLQAVGFTGVGERRSGVESLVHELIEGASMECIAAGFHGVVEVPAARLSILRREIRSLDRDFLDGLNTYLTVLIRLPPDAVGGVLSFHANGLRAGGHPVNSQGIVVGEGRARQQRHNRQW